MREVCQWSAIAPKNQNRVEGLKSAGGKRHQEQAAWCGQAVVIGRQASQQQNTCHTQPAHSEFRAAVAKLYFDAAEFCSWCDRGVDIQLERLW